VVRAGPPWRHPRRPALGEECPAPVEEGVRAAGARGAVSRRPPRLPGPSPQPWRQDHCFHCSSRLHRREGRRRRSPPLGGAWRRRSGGCRRRGRSRCCHNRP
jgi:hypothetical protein